jgi:hypothetical protein
VSFLLTVGSSDFVPSRCCVTEPKSGKSSFIFFLPPVLFWNFIGPEENLISLFVSGAPLGLPVNGPEEGPLAVLDWNRPSCLPLSLLSRFHPLAPDSYSCSSCLRFFASMSLRSLMRAAESAPSVMSVFSSSLDS